MGLIGAGCIITIMKRYWIPDFLHNPVSLMLIIATFTISNHFQAESGLLAVTIMGIVLANQRTVTVKHIIEFKENLRVLLISILFILLSANLVVDISFKDFSLSFTELTLMNISFIDVLLFLGILIFIFMSSRLTLKPRPAIAATTSKFGCPGGQFTIYRNPRWLDNPG